MGRLFGESRAAYEGGDRAGAKSLSDRAKKLRLEKDRLNLEAADWIFEQNNKGRPPGEVDLHGLHAEEAVERTEKAILDTRQGGLSELRLIVGKGIHSQNHEAVLKPRIEELMQKHKIVAELDPDNSGVLVVYFDGRGRTKGREIDPSEITRRLGDQDKSCIVM
ncbi:Smr-domain-containing protein [Phellopilus nigrolimitatus]|nr:Smr-domain-containing protein [Phellopilus nigrolimitatus]